MSADVVQVVAFTDADPSDRALLGGKGAGLAAMTKNELPVPPGFIVTTAACAGYYRNDATISPELWSQVETALAHLESSTLKRFDDASQPLLVSVRSGAAISMPGMMDTVLNLGLNITTTAALAKLTGDEDFAWDCYRRFVQMYGEIVLGVEGSILRGGKIGEATKAGRPTAATSKELVRQLQDIVLTHSGLTVPTNPHDQLRQAIAAVFGSWMNRRAIDYRQLEGIPDDIYTAVNVQAMVFGNTGPTSGTGVVFTRNPTTGEPGLWGEYLPDAQGEDVVAGIRTPLPIGSLADTDPNSFAKLTELATRLEQQNRDMQDIEFTIERGELWLLQTRNAKRTGRAAVRVAVDMANEGVLSSDEAVLRVSPSRLDELLHPIVQPDDDTVELVHGLPASPGGATGVVCFTADAAVALVEQGADVILVRNETSPDDFHGMVAAQAIVTARGGVTSHAAVVARGMGKCCVVGCEDLIVDLDKQLLITPNGVVSAGERITVDGTTGIVYRGLVPTVDPVLDDDFETLMNWADQARRLGVRANADNGHDAAVARSLGAEGIGLCRTEHMFFEGERIDAMRKMIMAPNAVSRTEALALIEPLQTKDFEELFEAMDGLPVTIRLLDPPLHEFLPHRHEIVDQVTDLKLQLTGVNRLADVNRILGEINELESTLTQIERLSEANPMLGHRGCRLGVSYPEITAMQARAIITAALRCQARGITVLPEIMVPLVAFAAELENQKETIDASIKEVFEKEGASIEYHVGTMIELPRAALTADQIAVHADFVSFGTNDLTQTTLGLSRDDSSRFLPGYVRRQILASDPFQTIDVNGVGSLVSRGAYGARSAKPGLKTGICGEHGGDPASIRFFDSSDIDYVSCSPYRVPIARLAAAHATLGDTTPAD
ncbi:MAG: pyruvate, phosphate dikinase [Acidimicrobiales bacterium]